MNIVVRSGWHSEKNIQRISLIRCLVDILPANTEETSSGCKKLISKQTAGRSSGFRHYNNNSKIPIVTLYSMTEWCVINIVWINAISGAFLGFPHLAVYWQSSNERCRGVAFNARGTDNASWLLRNYSSRRFIEHTFGGKIVRKLASLALMNVI